MAIIANHAVPKKRSNYQEGHKRVHDVKHVIRRYSHLIQAVRHLGVWKEDSMGAVEGGRHDLRHIQAKSLERVNRSQITDLVKLPSASIHPNDRHGQHTTGQTPCVKWRVSDTARPRLDSLRGNVFRWGASGDKSLNVRPSLSVRLYSAEITSHGCGNHMFARRGTAAHSALLRLFMSCRQATAFQQCGYRSTYINGFHCANCSIPASRGIVIICEQFSSAQRVSATPATPAKSYCS